MNTGVGCHFFLQCMKVKSERDADDTTLMTESEEELKSLLMKGKMESEKVGYVP